jgi:excisionase family DNA binding protein
LVETFADEWERAIDERRTPDPVVPIGDRPLTVANAAQYVRVSKNTIYDAVKRSDLAAGHVGSRARVTKADLDAWMRGPR